MVQNNSLPRIICYQQTHFHNGQYISLLPLLTENARVTHVIIAAIHLNEKPGDITLNNDAYDDPRNSQLWAEVQILQQAGVKVLGMLGGAAKGSYTRLDTQDDTQFRAYYDPLRTMLLMTGLDGVDLDIEEDMSLDGIIRLVDQIREDFGPEFLITMAPVATALQGSEKTHLSGFDYREFDEVFGDNIAWYNVQFYCGWGSAHTTEDYDAIIANGWTPDKVVLGLMTSPNGGAGWLPDDILQSTLLRLKTQYPRFGGVMGWEYFGSITAAEPFGWPWSWAKLMTKILHEDG